MGLIGPIECQSIGEMKTVMDTNFFGLVRLVKEILPDMKRRKRGHIVVISSVMGIQGGGVHPLSIGTPVCGGKNLFFRMFTRVSCRNSLQ